MALVSALVLIARMPVLALAAAAVAAMLLVVHIRLKPDGFVPAVVLRSAVFRTAATSSAGHSPGIRDRTAPSVNN
jgi:hypothetical protein